LPQLVFEQIEIDGLAQELGRTEFGRTLAPLVVAIRRHHLSIGAEVWL
jgi:hypothetical protein